MKYFLWLLMVIAVLATAAQSQPATTRFSTIDIEKPAPVVEFKDSRPVRIAGGVEITLRSDDETVKPMRLAAEEIVFDWPAEGGSRPTAINLHDKVQVDSPQGLIASDQAQLDLRTAKLMFTGNVSGKSDEIDAFEADSITYDLETGDSEMVNLRAKGITLGSAPEGKGSGSADYSAMDVDRAGSVDFSGGRVNQMSGGVAMTLHPAQPKAKALKLSAASIGLSWSPAGTPSAIQMRNQVRVNGPQGDIRSQKADFNLAKKTLEFTGAVKGSSDQIKAFDTDKLTYNLESGETLMTNLRAQGLALEQPNEKETPDSGMDFSHMDIEKAPEVSMTAGKLNWIRGGVNFRLRSIKPEEKPLVLQARNVTFAYPDTASSPDQVLLEGDINVAGPTTTIQSDSANLSMADKKLTFVGNVRGEQPGLTGVTANRATYNLATGDIKLDAGHIDELDTHLLKSVTPEQQ